MIETDLHESRFVAAFGVAIATMEGFYKPGSRAARNMNPGNLRSWGRTPLAGGYASFARPSDGWAALHSQIRKNIKRGLNTFEFFAGKPGVYAGYAPSGDSNDPANYARFVAKRLGIDPSVPLRDLIKKGA